MLTILPTNALTLEERVSKLEMVVEAVVGGGSLSGGSLAGRVAELERVVASMQLMNLEGEGLQPVKRNNYNHGSASHNNTDRSGVLIRDILSKLINPSTKEPYGQTQNDNGFCFGDKVYARHYKKLTNTWENKPGYVAGHSGKMVWIAEEPITSVYCVVSHKYNRNVLRR